MPDDQTKPGETPGSTPPQSPPDAAKLAEEVSSLKSYVEELKAESIKHRHQAKASSSVIDNLRTALGIEGDPATIEVKVKDAVAQKDATIKQLILEHGVERAAAKAGLRKPELAGRLLDLADLEIDLASKSVKGDLDAKFEALKKDLPELFGATPGAPAAPKPPAGTQDPGAPSAGVKVSVIEAWQSASKAQDRQAMAKLMAEHGAVIGQHIDSLRGRGA